MTDAVKSTAQAEIRDGKRFGFGANWSAFLAIIDETRVAASTASLTSMLPSSEVRGRRFLDIGCGSGLSSLAAFRSGAAEIHSLDFDPECVACAAELKRRFAASAANWSIASGSVLDRSEMARLGQWDIVYSWGVLHHTGRMWDALENAGMMVRPGGRLFIAIYNDQGLASTIWLRIKQAYNNSAFGRAAIIAVCIPYFVLRGLAKDLVTWTNPMLRYNTYRERRGMSVLRDWLDWLGGLPFEVATPEKIFDFYRERGFTLERLQTSAGGLGCNQFVFRAAGTE